MIWQHLLILIPQAMHEITRGESSFPIVSSATSHNLVALRPHIRKPLHTKKRCDNYCHLPKTAFSVVKFPAASTIIHRLITRLAIWWPAIPLLPYLPSSSVNFPPLFDYMIQRLTALFRLASRCNCLLSVFYLWSAWSYGLFSPTVCPHGPFP